MRTKKISSTTVIFFCLALALCLAGCATKGAPAKSDCKADIEWQVTPEAEITQFECQVGAYQKAPALVFTVGIKNVSDKPLRYRLNIFLLDKDKAAGYLVPRTGKPPVLAPGKGETVKVPFVKTADPAKKILVVVKTVGY